MLKNLAQPAGVVLLDTAGAVVTSGTTTVYLTGDNGAQASVGTATHKGNGQWTIALTAANTNYDHVALLWVNAGAVPVNQSIYTDRSYDRIGANGAGLTQVALSQAFPSNFADLAINASSGEVFLSSLQETSIAAAIELAILNEGDGRAVLQAIADQVAQDWVAGDASALAIASAVWASATRSLTDKAGFSIAGTIQNLDDMDTAQDSQHSATLSAVNGIQTDLDNGTDGLGALLTAINAVSGGSNPQVLLSTTIAAVNGQQDLDLTAGSPDMDNGPYDNQLIIITDQSTGNQKAWSTISASASANNNVTLQSAPQFTVAAGDSADIIALTGSAIGLLVDANGRVDLGSILGNALTGDGSATPFNV